jgi:hypothetical protein
LALFLITEKNLTYNDTEFKLGLELINLFLKIPFTFAQSFQSVSFQYIF